MTPSDDAVFSDRARRAKTLNWMRQQTGDLSFSAADVVRFLRRFDASDVPQSSPASRKSLALAVLGALQQDRRRENRASLAQKYGPGLQWRTRAPARSSDRFDMRPEDYPFNDVEDYPFNDEEELSFPEAILDAGAYVGTYCDHCGQVIFGEEGCVLPSDTDYLASANEEESVALCEKCAAGLTVTERLQAIGDHLDRALNGSSEQRFDGRRDPPSAHELARIVRRLMPRETRPRRPLRQMCRARSRSGEPCPNVATLVEFRIIVADDGTKYELYPELCDQHLDPRRVAAEITRLSAPTASRHRCKSCATPYLRVADDLCPICPSCEREEIIREYPQLDPWKGSEVRQPRTAGHDAD